MRVRTIALITAILFVLAAVAGVINRQSFTDYTADGLVNFKVGLLHDSLVDSTIDYMEEELSNANYILRVRAGSGMEFLFGSTQEPVTVVEVYKGEGLQSGDEIKVTRANSTVFMDDMSVNMGFVNEMQTGDEYLVFLDYLIEADTVKEKNIYRLSEFIVTPIFSYQEHENVLAVPKSDWDTSVPYTEVENNEFFAVTQYGIDRLNELKAKLLEQYPAF